MANDDTMSQNQPDNHTKNNNNLKSTCESTNAPSASASSYESQCQVNDVTPMNTTRYLEGYVPTEMDIKMSELRNGEHIHDNDGTHLDGG